MTYVKIISVVEVNTLSYINAKTPLVLHDAVAKFK